MKVAFVGVDDLGRLVAQLDDKADGMDSRTGMVVRKALFDIERGAKQRAPVDTGFLRNSIVTHLSIANMRANGGEVVAEADYSVFVEYGTSRMAPQPFMNPALEAVLPGFTAAMEALANPLPGGPVA